MTQKKRIVEFNKQTPPEAKKAVKKTDTDEVLSGLDKFEYLIGQYWKQIVTGVVILALIVVGLLIFKHVSEQKDQKLRQDFAQAQTTAELSALIEKNASHPSAVPARNRLGNLYAAQGAYESAYAVFHANFTAENAEAFARIQAELSAAAMQEMAKHPQDAVKTYQEIINNTLTQELQRGQAIYECARILLDLGKTGDAENMLKKIADDRTRQNPWAEKCSTLKARLPRKTAGDLKPIVPPAAPEKAAGQTGK